jgi:ribosomal peptide maturation radical SAM protein 1
MRVTLISMPFGPLNFPSIALAQLKSALEEHHGNQLEIKTLYLNHDFGEEFGQEAYNSICQNEKSADPNYGDWVFSAAAFPEMPDNTEAYFELTPKNFRKSYREHYDGRLKKTKERIPEILETLIDKHDLLSADVIGYTSMFAQTIASIAMAKAVRRRDPSIIQVMGGANCEFPMGVEYAHHFGCFDAVFSGPGLVSFPTFIGKLLEKNREATHQINGVFTDQNTVSCATFPDNYPLREKPGALIKNGIREIGDERPVGDLLELDYDDFLEDYDRRFSREIEEPFIVFETSRGCWWGQKSQCTFCGLNGLGMNYRAMEADKALEFLDGLMKRYRGKVEHFECVDNIMPRSFTKDVFPYLNPPEDVEFFWEVKANLRSKDLVALAQANVWEIQPGVEALNTDTLHLMKKGATAFTNVGLLRDSMMYEIKVLWYLLMGFPGEKEEVFLKYIEDMPRLVHLRPPVALVPVEYHRFSPYYDQAKEYGLELAPAKFYGVNYPLPEKVLFNLAYYFRDIHENSEPEVAASKANAPTDEGWYLPPSMDSSYKGELKRHWNDINDGWAYWQKRFDGSDGLPAAQLFYRQDLSSRVVVDTRTGRRIRHRLSELEFAVLRSLNAVKSFKKLTGEFTSTPESELRAVVDRLDQELLLVFKEGDQYMSLVPAQRYVDIPSPKSRSEVYELVEEPEKPSPLVLA